MNEEQTTYEVEFSYEATTLDYLNPLWYPVKGFEATTSKEAAEAEVSRLYAVNSETLATKGWSEPIAYRVKEIRPKAEVDAFLAAEFEANRQFWADRAEAARAVEEAVRNLYALKGQTVKVVKGRKVPVGTEGVVFWVGEGRYGWRVGFETAEGETHWTSTGNVEPVKQEVSA